ncbi:DUF2905 family protein [Kallotenue papyrolyticum]|uniref:DUF2905 family protein n=1 Tax=Kallotenue papyrolyticum TaxID=1325125 RepID=UPI000478562B|nr:DUF2905 domain-containing protein [Kallotenue papyrolyticum]
MSPGEIGRWLIMFGLLLVIVGGLLLLLGRVPWLGRLPGDLRIERGNLTCFVPLATSLLLSLVLTILLNVLVRLLRH